MINKRLELVLLLTLIGVVYFFYLKDCIFVINKENVISSNDGYFYANITKSIVKDEYTPINYLKNIPDYVPNQPIPPLHSLISAYIYKFLNTPLEAIFALFAPLTAPLFILTFYLTFRKYLPFFAIASGAFLGSLNFTYFQRCMCGRFDTDSVILFFIFLIYFFIFKIAQNINSTKRIVVYSIIVTLSFKLFMLFYPKPIFLSIFLVSLILAVVSFQGIKVSKLFLKNIALSITILLIGNVEVVFSSLFSIFNYMKNYLLRENTKFMSDNLVNYILELQPLSYSQLKFVTFDNDMLLLLSVAGFTMLLYKHWKVIIPVFPVILIGLLSFKSGSRFFIYVAPFLGMGFGYLVYIVYSFLSKKLPIIKKPVYSLLIILIMLLSVFPTSIAYLKPIPYVSDEVFNEFKVSKKALTEDFSYVWSNMNYGNLIQYIWEKGTLLDGSSFPIQKVFAYGYSLMSNSLEKSYKTISYITNHHSFEYEKLKQFELYQEFNKYKKPVKKTVYFPLFIDLIYEYPFHKLGAYGRLDIEKFSIPLVKAFKECKVKNNLIDCYILKLKKLKDDYLILESEFNADAYMIEIINRQKQVSKTILLSPIVKNEELFIEIIEDKGKFWILIANKLFYTSSLNKLFVKNEKNPYFINVYDNFPKLVVFRLSENID